jgi:drug/metabolite transporter (DMT)-like permease
MRAGAPGVSAAASSGVSRHAARGYTLVGGSFLLFATSAPLVVWADAPGGVLLVVRYAVASAALLLLFARRRPLRAALHARRWRRLLLLGALDAGMMLAYFFAARSVGVALATFFFFLQPVWVALLAPRFFHVATERVVYAALGLALAGMTIVVWPSLLGTARVSLVGLAAALASGWIFAMFQLAVKRPAGEVPYETLVTSQCLVDLLLLLPLGLWQFLGTGYGLTAHDWIAGLVMGLVTTALGNTMWWRGVARISVQHSSILGLITPVAAPVYAFIFLGQSLPASTIAGGILILSAGALVVVFGRGETALEPPP